LKGEQAIAEADRATVTGSRAADGALFLLLVVVAVVGSWRMQVYFRVTVAEIRATRIDADGSRHEIEVPANLGHTLAATHPPQVLLDELAPQMESIARREEPASRTEWTVRYSYNSSRLDHVRVFEFPAQR
jgi:hypothetical protein